MKTRYQRRNSVLRRPEVESQTGIPRSSMYKMIADGQFPPQILTGKRRVGWLQSEIDSWLSSRSRVTRKGGK